MGHNLRNNEVAVARDYFWLPMDKAPRGVKVQALTTGRVAVHAVFTESNLKYFEGWTPVPKEPPWLKYRDSLDHTDLQTKESHNERKYHGPIFTFLAKWLHRSLPREH